MTVVMNIPITEAIKSGDAMTLSVLARVVNADTADGMGKLGVRIQKDVDGYPGFGDRMLDIAST